MTKEEITGIVKLAARDLSGQNAYLLENSLQELSVVHHFADHLRRHFESTIGWRDLGLSIDCEYNRFGDEKKTVPREDEAGERQGVRPDIIVHQRGPNGRNLLAIEVKLTSNAKPKKVIEAKTKLAAYRNHLGYEFALYICIRNGSKFTSMPSAESCYSDLEFI